MAQNLRLALFDYDGTIVDSAIMIVEGAIAAFRICGLPDPDPAKVRENIGKPLAIAPSTIIIAESTIVPS